MTSGARGTESSSTGGPGAGGASGGLGSLESEATAGRAAWLALGEGQGLGCGVVLGSWVTQAFR